MGFYRHIEQCNQYQAAHFLPLQVDGVFVGELRHAFAGRLAGLAPGIEQRDAMVSWTTDAAGFDSLNRRMEALTGRLLEAGLVPYRRGELYPVTAGRREDVLFLMDRAVVPYFGVAAFGQHMNGFVRRADGIYLWVARRSLDRRHAPGKLDNLVAGGLPWGLSLEQNLAKECWEEAAIPAELAAQARQVGYISYRQETAQGLKPDTMYCYDLELPADFTPRCTDGEVSGFELLPVGEVAELVEHTDEFKLNCNLVIIDFLIRHGYLDEGHPEHAALRSGLRRPPRGAPAAVMA